MKIVFFGSPHSSVICLNTIMEAGYDIPLIVTQPDRYSGRGKKISQSPLKQAALNKGIPVCQPRKIKKDKDIVKKLKKIQPDLNVVVAYGQIIPASIIYLPPYNSINLHFSLLPKYRGASPVQWALLNGEKKTGVTIFQLNEKMDEGDILFQEEIPILPEDNFSELEKKLSHLGAQLLLKTIKNIDTIKPLHQDDSRATYAPLIKKEDGRIDWNQPASSINNKIRAFNPWPSAFTYFSNKRVKIIKGTILDKKSPSTFSTGQIIELTKKGIEVCCGQKTVYLIQRLQPENKKQMDAFSFSLGVNIKKGDMFI